MNHPSDFPCNLQPLALAKNICESNNKILRELFRGKINTSFLIKIKSMVFAKLGADLIKYFPLNFNSAQIMTGTDDTPEYDVCKMIVGVHRHYSIFLSKEQIHSNQKSIEYQDRIVNEVIEKIKLKQFGSVFFRRKQLLLGDEFLYFPVPYELFVMCMRSFYLINNRREQLFAYYSDLLKFALSELTLMENGFLSSAYPLCRSMIELYLKILILEKHPNAYADFQQFCAFEIEQSCCSQKYTDTFNARYIKRKNLTVKSKSSYLHFGWLDSIEDYSIKKSNRYSIYGILDYLMESKKGGESLERIKTLYKMCHGYVHGSTIHVKYPLLQYFEISNMIYLVVKPVFTDIYRCLGIEMAEEDKFLLGIVDRDFRKLDEQYGKRSTENFELYYKLHTC